MEITESRYLWLRDCKIHRFFYPEDRFRKCEIGNTFLVEIEIATSKFSNAKPEPFFGYDRIYIRYLVSTKLISFVSYLPNFYLTILWSLHRQLTKNFS